MSDRANDPSIETVTSIVQSMQRVAVLGAHESATRPAHYVPEALHQGGIEIVPVNERFVGKTLWGKPVLAKLDDIEGPVDVVDVFRRPDVLPTHLPEILGMNPLPQVVWLQKGIRNDDFAEVLRNEGITVVQDRCLMVDFRSMR